MKSPVPHSALWALVFVAQLPMLVLYLLRLHRDPLYGWWPLIALLVVALLVWRRWDGKTELPRRPLPGIGLCLGILAGLAAGLLGNIWLAGFAFCCISGAWLATHHQQNGMRLSSTAYITWSLLQIPLGGNAKLTRLLGISLEHSIESLLRLGQLPHVFFNDSVEVIGVRYYFDQAVYSWLSWPLCLTLAMVHSAIWRRTWFEAVFNVFSALFWCFAFHCGLLLSCLQLRLPLDSWGAGGLSFLWGAITFGLFLSTERGLRLLLQPMSESSLDSRFANPYVIAWNYCFSPPPPRKAKRRPEQQRLRSSTAWILVAGVAVTLSLQLVSIPRAWAALSTHRDLPLDRTALQTFVFQKLEDFEHRRSYHSTLLALHREVDIWSVYAPLSTTEHILDIGPQPVFELQSRLPLGGWEVDSAELVPAKLPNGQHLNYGNIAMHQGRQRAHVYYAWLGADGTPLPVAQGSGSGYLLISKVDLVEVYAAATKRTVVAEFSRFVVGVQTQLHELAPQQ